MTHLLEDLLRERADAAPGLALDLPAITAAGERRVHHRRWGVRGGVALAAAAAVTGVVLAVVPGGDPDADDVGPADEPTPDVRGLSYTSGSVLHLPLTGEALDLGAKVRAYVATDDGVVWLDTAGTVTFTPADGGDPLAVGTVADSPSLQLRADDTGSLVAWVEAGGEDGPEVVAYDTDARREVLRLPSGGDDATVVAVDDGAVYWVTDTDVTRTDAATGDSEVVGDPDDYELQDVADATFLARLRTPPGVLVVGEAPGDGLVTGRAGDGTLSPSGRYTAVEENDQLAVLDNRTGEEVTSRDDVGYDLRVAFAWLDDDTLALYGIRAEPEDDDVRSLPVDLLTCDVPAGTCRVGTTVDVDPQDFALPTGERLD